MKSALHRFLFILLILLLGLGLRSVHADELVEELWSIVHVDGVKSGHVHTTVHRVQEDGQTLIKTFYEAEMTMLRGGTPLDIEQTVEMFETEDGKPIRFTMVMKQGGLPIEISGLIKDGKYIRTQTVMGQEQASEFGFDAGTIGLHGLELLMQKNWKENAIAYTAKVLIPDLPRVGTLSFTSQGKDKTDVLGKEMELNRIDSTIDLLPGAVASTWFDDEMNFKKEELRLPSMTQTSYYVSKEEALAEEVEIAKLPDIMTKTFIRPDHPIAHPRGVRSATFILKPKEQEIPLLPVQDTIQTTVERQEDGSILLKVRAVAPEGETVGLPVEAPDLKEFLEPNIFLQCNDPDILAEAKRIVGDEKDAYQAAKKLESWVYEHIDKKSLDVGFASAKEVFTDRKGDCTEHGVLLAAMARSVRIPSRVATGVEYVFGIFGWHMWTEVWVGEWVPLDATLAFPYVDATHIKFFQSSLKEGTLDEAFLAMVGVLGNVDIEVVDYVLDGETIKPGDPSAQPVVDGNRWSHPVLGVSLEKPEGWTFDEGDTKTLVYIRPPEWAHGKAQIRAKATALSYDSTVETIVEALTAQAKVKERRETELGGHPAIYVDLGESVFVITQPTDTLYGFELENPTDELRNLFEEFLKTVKIKN